MEQPTRVVISVMGRNQVGILAATSKVLADQRVDIVDITQKIVDDLFLMMIVADLPATGLSLHDLNEALKGPAGRMGLQVVAQHEKLFKYMHRV
jgi:ACT domain-containing protein